jgi:hypothetical protein
MTTPAPLLVSDDVRAIEQALEWLFGGANTGENALAVAMQRRDALRRYDDAATPARLRRILDTMRAMGEALDLTHHTICLAGWEGDFSAEKARAALTLYRGEAQ